VALKGSSMIGHFLRFWLNSNYLRFEAIISRFRSWHLFSVSKKWISISYDFMTPGFKFNFSGILIFLHTFRF
jgi:hypothetical protein